MEESVALLAVTPLLHLSVHTQVHVAIDGGVVVPYRYALGCGEQLCEVAGCGGDGIAW
jgi:hypothetical protein